MFFDRLLRIMVVKMHQEMCRVGSMRIFCARECRQVDPAVKEDGGAVEAKQEAAPAEAERHPRAGDSTQVQLG